ncbi:DEAD-box ATP-dependent RNA helicase 21 [Bienertia sinuspersici]
MKRPLEEVATVVASAAVANNSSNNVKPVFLTKAQREQLALQRREEEVAEQKLRAQQILQGGTAENKTSDSSHIAPPVIVIVIAMNPHEAQLLFGRGFRAGIDRREQKKLAAKNEVELREEIRKKDGTEEKPEEVAAQKRRELAAEVYDTFDMRVDRHWSEKRLEEMTERDWRIFREDFNIAYKGSKIPRPMRNWAESKLSSELLQAVERAKYKTPSPIQMAAIPLGLQQRDVIGVAETGSGCHQLVKRMKLRVHNAVVMAPTRELAQQIEEETSIEEQGFKIRKGCEIVIATPGRLLDCLERRYVVLNQCNYVVLDEADRMIDMGFEPQVVGVLDAMPSSNMKPENEEEELDEKRIYRTTYMFSATMPPAVERLARSYRVTTLHGGKSQEQREISLEGFRTKRYNVMVATDVAGRGIDIPDVAHVINYDMPGNIEMYTHRIGRTGRAGKTGMLIQSNSPVPPELARHEASKFKPGSIPDRPPRRNETLFAH